MLTVGAAQLRLEGSRRGNAGASAGASVAMIGLPAGTRESGRLQPEAPRVLERIGAETVLTAASGPHGAIICQQADVAAQACAVAPRHRRPEFYATITNCWLERTEKSTSGARGWEKGNSRWPKVTESRSPS